MAKTDCHEAIEAFEGFLNAPEERRSGIAGALDHLSGCPACREQAGRLVRLLAAGTADEDVLTCEACQEVLPGFLAAESLGECSGPECDRVRRHLEACPHCAAAHTSLAGLLSLAHGDSGAEPPRYPGPDLSFLREFESSTWGRPAAAEHAGTPAAARPEEISLRKEVPLQSLPSNLWQEALEGMVRLAAAIPVLIGRAGASFGALDASLTVQLASVPVYRDKRSLAPAEETRDFREVLELPQHDLNVALKLSLGPVFGDRVSVALAVNQIAPPEPIAQERVTLRDAGGGLLEGASTGDDGVVLFRDLDVGEYLIRVEHAGRALELQLVLQSS